MSCHAKEQMRDCVVACLLFFSLFWCWLTPMSVVLRLYEAHARQSEIQQCFFSFLRGLEDAGESLWYKICYTVHVRPSAFTHVLLERVTKYSVFCSHVAPSDTVCRGRGDTIMQRQSNADLCVSTFVTLINDCWKWKNTNSVCNILFAMMLRPSKCLNCIMMLLYKAD